MKEKEHSFIDKYVKIIVVFAVIAGSASGVFGRLIDAPPMAIGFWRLAMGMPFFLLPMAKDRFKKVSQVGSKDKMLAALGGFFLFAHFYTWFTAVKNTNIASASVLAALHPVVVLFITVFIFRKKVKFSGVLAIILAIMGGSLIAGFDYSQISSGNFYGDIMAVGAAFFMGLYFATGDYVRKRVDGPTYVFMVFASCLTCFTLGMFMSGTAFFKYSPESFLYLVGLTLVCQIGSHAVFNLCFGHVSSLYVSAWESGESVFAIILSFIFLQQIPTKWEILGGTIVVMALIYYNFVTRDDEERQWELENEL